MSLLTHDAARMQFDSDALAIIAAMTTSPPMPQRRVDINNLVVQLKAAGIWSLLDVFWILAAQDPQGASINWKAPSSFTLTPAGTITFVGDRGYTSNGTTGRLGTSWNPSVNGSNYTLNDSSVFVWSLTDVAANSSTEIGANESNAHRVNILPRNASNVCTGFINANNNWSQSMATSIGLFMGQRRAAADTRLFKDGVQVGGVTATASTARPNVEAWLCAQNPGVFGQRQIACGGFGASLTGLEATFYSIVLRYMQAVGAAA